MVRRAASLSHFMLAAILLIEGQTVNARDPNAESACREQLESFMAAWNTGEDANLRKEMNFPFVTFVGGSVVNIVEKAEDFSQRFDRMREREGWASSSFDFDTFEIFDSSADKVHCAIDYHRFKADGAHYGGGRVAYIVTKEDGDWGVQLRSPISMPENFTAAARTEAERGARQAALDYMTAFNAADAAASTRHLNFPHLFMTGGTRVSIGDNPAHASVLPDFARMREREGWHFSSFDSIDASVVTPDKVHLDVVFSRWHPDGRRYLTIPALWIATRVDGKWGIQLRSLMPAAYREN